MMLLFATTFPLDEAARVVELDIEFRDVVELVAGNVDEPDNWLTRGGALEMLILLFNLSKTSIVAAGPVFMRSRGAWAITSSPSADRRCGFAFQEAGGLGTFSVRQGEVSIEEEGLHVSPRSGWFGKCSTNID